MQSMTRQKAAAAGLFKYFGGRPCRRGHNAYRYTKTGACSACCRVYTAKNAEIANNKQNDFTELKLKIRSSHVQIVKDFIKALELAENFGRA